MSRRALLLAVLAAVGIGLSAARKARAQAPEGGPPALPARPEMPEAGEFVVRTGARIPLALINSLSTKRTRDGDRIYLETAFPVAMNGRIVIPRGSYVAGTVTRAKPAGRVTGKSELYIRFDSLTLPNGVTREFRSRMGAADAAAGIGKVDREEGRIAGDSARAADARRVGDMAGAGASVGTIAGAAAGHTGLGAGVGAAAGAAAGLFAVLLSRGPDVVLPRGTTVEMILDRDLRFTPEELGFQGR